MSILGEGTEHSTRESRHKTGKEGKPGELREPNTAQDVNRTARIRVKNRRKMYLDRHPSYFESHELELADPLLYDRCVRRFQSATEREADGRLKGYSGVLEADLFRSEAKLAALRDNSHASSHMTPSSSKHVTYIQGPDGQILPEDPDEIPRDKEEGLSRWKDEMTIRFLRGEDNDFSYTEVDENDEWDVIEKMEEEDRWFEEEEPHWIGGEGDRQGETGIQDF